ncbi:P-II family nitrogen regulator [Pyruvatibacter mobilis]|jgi:nitrogen regulatory protein P-II 2|uniref:P-II family nitrogen regulator n=1 Tax=Pyruvatibacter mobilis TaxID=1712261 RepID=UPI0003F5FF6E
MRMVTAIIKPSRIDEVLNALSGIGIQGLTVTEVKGYGRQKGQTEVYRGAEYIVQLVPKVRVDVACDDAMADKIVDAIAGAAKTGKIGDGKIFVSDLMSAMRIRTGEAGNEAING